MINKNDYFFVGKITKMRGIKGEVEVEVDEDFDGLYDAKFFMLPFDNIFIPFCVESVKNKNNSVIIVKFKDIDNKKSDKLVNKEVYQAKPALFEDNDNNNEEVPINSLFDFTLFGKEQGEIGIITNIDNSNMNVLFTVASKDGAEYLIPFHNDLIVNLDFDKKSVTLDLPQDILSI